VSMWLVFACTPIERVHGRSWTTSESKRRKALSSRWSLQGPRPRAFHERGASCARTLRLYAVKPYHVEVAVRAAPSLVGVKKYMV
jgi:hypothetical protein